MRPLSLIVTDASPPITLAAADALECLTMANVPTVIPDMVYFEVTQAHGHIKRDLNTVISSGPLSKPRPVPQRSAVP